MKIFVVVGELSGDLLAAGLVNQLQNLLPHSHLEVIGVVGPNLIAVGAKELYSMQHLAMMGFIEPLLKLPKLIYLRYQLYQKILAYKPDVFIGVDAPDFNLGLERKLKKAKITTVHYVSPSVWAWRTGRIKLIKQAVDLMLTLFPFEVDIYNKNHIKAICVGHPMADLISIDVNQKIFNNKFFNGSGKILTIMPGSRNSELHHLSKIYLQVAKELFLRFPFIKFLLPVTCAIHKTYIENLINKLGINLPIKVTIKNSHEAIKAADFVLVTSGTATLEVMLHKKPMVVAYKTNFFTYWILKKLVTIKYIALPNLLSNSLIVPEFVQEQATIFNLTRALSKLITSGDLTSKQKYVFNQIYKDLQKNANATAAQEVIKLLSCNTNI